MVFGNNLIDFGAFVAPNLPSVIETQNIEGRVKSVRQTISHTSTIGQINEVNSITTPQSPNEQGSVEETDVSAIVNEDVNEEVLGEPVLEEITTTSSGIGTNASGEEVGLSGMSQSDEEQLADKADETHISGGNEPEKQTSSSEVDKYAITGLLLLGAGYGAYKYENKTSFFSRKFQQVRKSIQR